MPSAYDTAPAANSPPRAIERIRSGWNPESNTCWASSRLAVPNISQVRTSRTSESDMAASSQHWAAIRHTGGGPGRLTEWAYARGRARLAAREVRLGPGRTDVLGETSPQRGEKSP